MPQPTISGLTLNAGAGGSSLAVITKDSKLWQAVAIGFNDSGGNLEVVTSDNALPVAATLQTLPAGANLLGSIAVSEQSGLLFDALTPVTFARFNSNPAAANANQIVAANADKKHRLFAAIVWALAASNTFWFTSAANAILGGSAFPFSLDPTGQAAPCGWIFKYLAHGWTDTAQNAALNIYLGTAAAIGLWALHAPVEP